MCEKFFTEIFLRRRVVYDLKLLRDGSDDYQIIYEVNNGNLE